MRRAHEHDQGTETLRRVVAKLDRYQQLAAADVSAPILFGLPGKTRETNLHRAITARYGPAGPAGLTVATTHTAPPTGHTTRPGLSGGRLGPPVAAGCRPWPPRDRSTPGQRHD